MVFQEADLSIRVLRDVLAKEFDGAIIDDPKQHQRVTSFFQRTAPELVELVELYEDREPLFERMGVEEAFRSVLSRRVDLPSGGYLMIDYAEALTVIDINTGSFTGRGKGRLEDTITKVNVEAAEEVVRQLRLRDIGGIIVIDFIDMARARNRDQVLKTLRKALDEDKTKSYVVEVSPLGLVEMTRQNVTDGVREILTKRCPTCDGEGVVESEETVAIEVVRRLRDVVEEPAEPEAFLIRVNPKVAAELLREDSGLHELEEESGKHFHFEGGDALSLDTFEVVERGTRAEIEERALPFQVGDEVLVRSRSRTCTTPTTRSRASTPTSSASPAAGRFVGERRLVRIESVGRSAATASLVDGSGGRQYGEAPPDDGARTQPDGGPVESPASRRRRGRRGGRRRSRAGPERRTGLDRWRCSEQLRDSRERRQAVPRREGREPVVDQPARGRGRQGHPARRHVPRRQGGRPRRRRAREGQGRGGGRGAPARAEDRGSSSTRRRRATGAAPGTARSSPGSRSPT